MVSTPIANAAYFIIIQIFMYFLQELSFFLLLLLIGRSNSSSKTELDAVGMV